MSDRTLLIATTPLTILVAAALARAAGGRWRLLLIEDFPDAQAWVELLTRWRDCPFEAVERLPGRASEAQAAAATRRRGPARRWAGYRIRRAQRRMVFARLDAIDREFAPTRIAIGNDRRPETQYALHLAAQRGLPRIGVYLDDGLFSYVGDVHARPLARALFDTPLKRLVWGRWWQSVEQVGTTGWIQSAWLACPARALDQDPARVRHPLPQAAFATRPLAGLALLAWRQFGGAVPAPRLHRVFALPHSKLLAREPAALAALRAQLAQCAARGESVAVKHHPRELSTDPLQLVAAGATLLPAGIAFELLLPFLVRGGTVLGQASTALLAARWLRPDLQVFDLGGSVGEFARRAGRFLATMGVQPIARGPAALDVAAAHRRTSADS